jgi:hypothetical protein
LAANVTSKPAAGDGLTGAEALGISREFATDFSDSDLAKVFTAQSVRGKRNG